MTVKFKMLAAKKPIISMEKPASSFVLLNRGLAKWEGGSLISFLFESSILSPATNFSLPVVNLWLITTKKLRYQQPFFRVDKS